MSPYDTGTVALGSSSDFTGIAAQLSAPKAGFTTNYYYNGGKLALETNGAGTTTAKTLQGIHLIKREVMNVQGIGLSQIQSDAAAKASGSAVTAPASSAIDKNGNMTYFFIQNSRGDVIKLLNENGDIIRDYEYAPFGKEADVKTDGYGADYFTAKWQQEVEDNAIDNPFRFGGEYKDEESGNYYLRARYYDPEIQRFTQEDTYKGNYNDPMSLNGYAFCGNDPINGIDPTGLKTVQVQSNGKAQSGLSKGDVVKTAGGNYTITAVNKDGSYKSEKVTSSNSSSSSSKSTSSGGGSGSSGSGSGSSNNSASTGGGSSGSRTSAPTKTQETSCGKSINKSIEDGFSSPDTLYGTLAGTTQFTFQQLEKYAVKTISKTKLPANIGKGTASKMLAKEVEAASKGLGGVSRIAGAAAKYGGPLASVAVGAYTASKDIQTYSGDDRTKALAITAGGTAIIVGAAVACAIFSAPALAAVGIGIGASILVDIGVNKAKSAWCVKDKDK